MAVLVVARFAGDADRLVGLIHQHVEPVMLEVAPAHGARWHTLSKTPEGLLVVDVWDAPDGLQRAMAEPAIQRAPAAGGLPQPQIDVYELVDHRSF